MNTQEQCKQYNRVNMSGRYMLDYDTQRSIILVRMLTINTIYKKDAEVVFVSKDYDECVSYINKCYRILRQLNARRY